ncbi:MAG: hypothetical protein KJ069_22760 [Anaerolineae bacterium]|nr:hypothetical protein [Anaerolineae bacterium]
MLKELFYRPDATHFKSASHLWFLPNFLEFGVIERLFELFAGENNGLMLVILVAFTVSAVSEK